MVHSLLALSTSFFNRYGTAGRVLLTFQCFKHKRSLTPPRMSWSVCVCIDGAIITQFPGQRNLRRRLICRQCVAQQSRLSRRRSHRPQPPKCEIIAVDHHHPGLQKGLYWLGLCWEGQDAGVQNTLQIVHPALGQQEILPWCGCFTSVGPSAWRRPQPSAWHCAQERLALGCLFDFFSSTLS